MTTADELRAKLENKVGVVGATCVLSSGEYFDFLDPREEMIKVEDIAWGLARACRFGGQMKRTLDFYSVAQHSVVVASMVPPELRWAALFHDAAEAYIGDMIGPVKQLFPEFKALEKRIEAVIFNSFGIETPLSPEIKEADLRALRSEQYYLTDAPDDQWNGLGQYVLISKPIVPVGPREAHDMWITAYTMLRTSHA